MTSGPNSTTDCIAPCGASFGEARGSWARAHLYFVKSVFRV